jgi:hypothetical protein
VGRNLLTKPDFSTRATHAYILCGWRTYSEIPLTGVPTLANEPEHLDIVIQVECGRSSIANSSGGFVFQHTPDRSLIKIEDIADFEIRDGRHIRVWPAAEATQKDIEIFLFGPAWATLCHQRGMLPLHASAIVTGAGITAFAGDSGAGKSTMAALLNSGGYELISDDILPVSFDHDSIPGAWPYLRRLKLHRDAIAELALTPTEVVSEHRDKHRYFVHPKHTGVAKWRRLERLYVLGKEVTDSGVPIEQITGADAVGALINQTYHFNFIRGTQRFGEHLAFCTRLASKIPIYRLRRSSIETGDKLRSLIYAHLEGQS